MPCPADVHRMFNKQRFVVENLSKAMKDKPATCQSGVNA
jgi:hypothetical protein